MLKQLLIIVLVVFVLFPHSIYAQSVVWDNKTQSWVSQQPVIVQQPTQPQAPILPAIPQTQQQLPQTVIQTVPTTPAGSSVDLGTLLTVITPILGGIAGIFFKQQKDMKKNDQQVEQKTTGIIENMILPLLKQNSTAV